MFFEAVETLNALPRVQSHLTPEYVELPFLAAIFTRLFALQAGAERYTWVIVSPKTPVEALGPLGKDHVLICIGNELGLLPDYARRVAHVFTPYLRQLPEREPIHVIPLGCNGHAPALPVLPLDQRALHVSFVGQVHPFRRDFIQAGLHFLDAAKPHDPIKAYFTFTPRFQSGLKPQVYAEILQQTQIAPVPWGLAPITFRLCEALRAGCVLVTGPLPPYPYLKALPALHVPANWQGFSERVFGVLQSPEQLLHLQQQGLRYYEATCSAAAVAQQMAQAIGRGVIHG